MTQQMTISGQFSCLKTPECLRTFMEYCCVGFQWWQISIHLTHWPLGYFQWNFTLVNLKLILVLDDWGISCAILPIGKSLGFTDDKSTLVQVMAWSHQATSHNLNQCWPRSKPPYGVIRSQWVNTLRLRQNGCHFPDNIFKCFFLKENVWISIKISLKFVPNGPTNNIPSWFR